MAFHDIRFPIDIPAAAGGVRHKTTVVVTAGGHEVRVAEWAVPLGRWTVDSRRLNEAGAAALIAFFRTRAGRLHSFRFRDPADWRATSQSFGIGDGATQAFQIKKRYVSGSLAVDRTIRLPVVGTVKVYKDGVLQGGGYTVNHTTGVVSFFTPPVEDVAIRRRLVSASEIEATRLLGVVETIGGCQAARLLSDIAANHESEAVRRHADAIR